LAVFGAGRAFCPLGKLCNPFELLSLVNGFGGCPCIRRQFGDRDDRSAIIYPVQRFVASNHHSFLGPLGLPTDERYVVEWMDIAEKQSSYMNSLVERLEQFGLFGGFTEFANYLLPDGNVRAYADY